MTDPSAALITDRCGGFWSSAVTSHCCSSNEPMLPLAAAPAPPTIGRATRATSNPPTSAAPRSLIAAVVTCSGDPATAHRVLVRGGIVMDPPGMAAPLGCTVSPVMRRCRYSALRDHLVMLGYWQ